MEGVGDEVLLFGAATVVGAVMLYYAVSYAIRQYKVILQCLHYKISPSGLCAEIYFKLVMGEKRDFQVELGLFRDLFWSRRGPFIDVFTRMQNCLKK